MTEDMLAIFIPIIAIVMGIGLAMISVVTRHRQQLQRADLRHKERLAAIEKGMELPPDAPETELNKPRYLLKGLVYSGIGIALYVALGAVAGGDVAMFAFIPFAIGIAYLIYYALRGRHEEATPVTTGRDDAIR